MKFYFVSVWNSGEDGRAMLAKHELSSQPNVTILADPAHIVGVWKAGRRVKGPRSDSDLTEHSSRPMGLLG